MAEITGGFSARQLLSEEYSEEGAYDLLQPAGFSDWRAAARRLRHISYDRAARSALAALLPQLLRALRNAASADRALLNLERLAQGVSDPLDLFTRLVNHPRETEMLVTLFAGSQYLTEILLRSPDRYDRIFERNGLAQNKSAEQFYDEARAAAASWLTTDEDDAAEATTLDALRRYQQWQLLRIGICDLCGLLDLSSVTVQLSRLADAIVRVCLEGAAHHSRLDLSGFSVLAMGKLGGSELNYSSDIDLLFIVEANAENYQRLGERLIKALVEATGEGFLYRVDMRLRPWGQVGPLIATRAGYLGYLEKHARLWEKQALLKARVVAGSQPLGGLLLAQATPVLFDVSQDVVRADVHAMKQRTEARLREQGRAWGEVKLGEGSIRDVEFVAQYLQLVYGAAHPELHTGNTLEALARLVEVGFLAADEYRILVDGYVFLRTVEHYLQILDYRQTHSLPADAGDLHYLAQRLGFQGPDSATLFVTRYQQHSAAVRAVYQRHLGGHAMQPSQARPQQPQSPGRPPAELTAAETGLREHLSRMSESYAATFSERDLQRHAALAAGLDEANPVEVEAEPLGDNLWRVTVVAYDYLGELSLICGLLFVHGFSIIEGHVHTYESEPPAPATGTGPAQGRRRHAATAAPRAERRKIVDVFIVRAVFPARAGAAHDGGPDLWLRYAGDLAALLRLLQARQQREAQGELAKRVATALRETTGAIPALHPIEIEIDNESSDRYTILRIDTPDTIGFLYEFTNALALNGIYIAQVAVASVRNRVQDTLYVTDTRGQKITNADRQRELRAATVLVKHFTHLLPHSPNPESALLHFHEYLGELFQRPSWPDELASLTRPEVLDALARLLGVSDFLWDDFLRMQYANLFPVVSNVELLGKSRSRAELAGELDSLLAQASDGAAQRDELNAFKDREMFRIDMRHIQGNISELGQFSCELTDLAETVVEAAYRICAAELIAQFGVALDEQGQPSRLCICAQGKCGGRELGFASDIELMFVFKGSGQTAGPRIISTPEFYEKLVVEFVRSIRARREGIFEIDLQLRPYGDAGSLAVSLDSFRRYFAPDGPAWNYERQALVRLRPIAGDPELGAQVAALRDAFVYTGAPFDVAAMRAMRERQLRHLVTAGTVNVKFSPGGLVDVEYIVQALQMIHGHNRPELRVTNTQAAMSALDQAGIISAENYLRLSEAHSFLLRLMNALRMVRGNNKDLTVPPEESEEFAFLARRLGYGNEPARLRVDLTQHTGWVQKLGTRLLG